MQDETVLTESQLLELAKTINTESYILNNNFIQALANSFDNSSVEYSRIEEDSKRFTVSEDTLQLSYGYRAKH
jgi:hypothetical protein